jgi:prophage DNA circulation protein
MTWQDRTRDQIEFFSPSSKRFFAYWQKNPRDMSHALAPRKYPKIKGAVVQDLSVGAVSHPINFFFEGENHDLEAQAFFEACKEDGEWEITHPTLGRLENLYLSSISEDLDRTENANVSWFRSVWLESIPVEKIISVPDITESLRIQSTIINDTSGAEFDRNVSQDTASERQAVVNTSRSLLGKIKNGLAALYELNAAIQSRINSIQRAISAALNEVILRPLTLAAQFQQLIQLPALATNDIKARLQAYGELADDILTLSPETIFPEDKNIAACLEMNLTAVLSVSAAILVSGPLATRREAIDVAEALLTLFETVTDGLDNIEALFSGEQADRQYFSQTDSYAEIYFAVSAAVNSVIQNSFELKIEKRFLLKKARAPFEITVTEYGELGENDSNLDLFYSSNKIVGKEFLLLPVGYEAVVYVGGAG